MLELATLRYLVTISSYSNMYSSMYYYINYQYLLIYLVMLLQRQIFLNSFHTYLLSTLRWFCCRFCLKTKKARKIHFWKKLKFEILEYRGVYGGWAGWAIAHPSFGRITFWKITWSSHQFKLWMEYSHRGVDDRAEKKDGPTKKN